MIMPPNGLIVLSDAVNRRAYSAARLCEMPDQFRLSLIQYVQEKRAFPEDRPYRFGYLPTETIIAILIAEDPEKREWADWFAFYSGRAVIPDHGNSVWGIIVQDRGMGDFIEDGWHRFHSYVQKGIGSVPVVFIN